MFSRSNPLSSEKKTYFVRIVLILLLISISVILIGYSSIQYLATPPKDFPTNTDIRIEEGMTHTDIGNILTSQHIIRSSLFFNSVLRFKYPHTYTHAGIYNFPEPHTTYEIIEAITQGTFQKPLISVTFPEGFRADDIQTLLPQSITTTNTCNPQQYEGYLFPDTYYISEHTTCDEILTLLRDTFRKKVQPYETQIASSGFSEEQVVILASLIEREGKDVESKKMVSGILQKRLKENMPLQVDATFDYVLHKESSELTDTDLNIDSPYNTYKNKGLPPTPIANPGIESIEAVLNPTTSDYLYYLTGTDGTFHYAKTFEEHKKNKSKFLK